MDTLTPSQAVLLVRKNLDEVGPNDSIMYYPNNENKDNESLDDIIKKNLPEAINAIHLAAPVQLLEGVSVSFEDGVGVGKAELLQDSEGNYTGVLEIIPLYNSETGRFLRLVCFRASDSDIIVTEAIPEAGPEARKQNNPFIRGRYDRPRLVQKQLLTNGSPVFDYYSIKEIVEGWIDDDYIKLFEFIPEQFYADDAQNYSISRRLRQNIIDYLTAMVMETYNDQRSQVFYQKANNFPSL